MKNQVLTLLLIAVLGISCKKSSNMMVIGHRGAMGHIMENTLPSIQKAMDLGVDMIEIDVFRIKSGEIVVFHDETLDKLSDGVGKIEEHTLDQLKEISLNGSHQIPTLKEVLDLIDNKVALNIELKGAHTAVLVNDMINDYILDHGWTLDSFVISSFNWDELKVMRKTNADIAIAVLTEENPIDAIPVAKKLNAVAVNPWFKNLTEAQVKAIHEAGFKVYTYTVNEPKDIERMEKFGVDGIFINYPERAL